MTILFFGYKLLLFHQCNDKYLDVNLANNQIYNKSYILKK